MAEQRTEPKGGLRIKLIRSHRTVAFCAIGALLIALCIIAGLRICTLRLATLRGPTAQASARALGGVQRSLAGLRSWMALGEPSFKETRRYAWEVEIEPSLAELHELLKLEPARANDKSARLDLAADALAKLKDVQRWIEDIAGTPGNEPARAMLDRDIEPLIENALVAITAIIDLEKEHLDGGKPALAAMSDFRGSLAAAHTALIKFVTAQENNGERPVIAALDSSKARFEELNTFRDALTAEQQELLSFLAREFKGIDMLARQAIDIHKSEPRTVAQHLLVTEAVPAAEGSIALLGEMSENEARHMRDDGRLLATLSTIAMVVATALVIVIALVARLLAGHNSRKILQPIAALSEATKALAVGETSDDIPVSGDDELADLTRSFNAMSASVYKSRFELDLERRLVHAMMENLPDNIYFKDDKSRFLLLSRAFANRVGLEDRSEAVGKTDYDFFDVAHAEQAFAD